MIRGGESGWVDVKKDPAFFMPLHYHISPLCASSLWTIFF